VPDLRQKILGIPFHVGGIEEAVELALQGGLIVVPSGPVLADLPKDPAQREALERCDFALTDSAFLVLLWLVFKGQALPRISGLRFLRKLLERPEFRQPAASFWIMPTAGGAQANCSWLSANGAPVATDACYVAPLYPAGPLEDYALLALIEAKRPKFVIISLGGGVQERLGYFLRTHLSYRPMIVCSGAAIAFMSGQQANIPPWADRLYLGWLLRSVHNPRRFVPRYWRALGLIPLLLTHGRKRIT
jgi:UDP-N-acetyl-D-mannosaminuronic acid transferase (WecB/TagA/CpsF family)